MASRCATGGGRSPPLRHGVGFAGGECCAGVDAETVPRSRWCGCTCGQRGRGLVAAVRVVHSLRGGFEDVTAQRCGVRWFSSASETSHRWFVSCSACSAARPAADVVQNEDADVRVDPEPIDLFDGHHAAPPSGERFPDVAVRCVLDEVEVVKRPCSCGLRRRSRWSRSSGWSRLDWPRRDQRAASTRRAASRSAAGRPAPWRR